MFGIVQLCVEEIIDWNLNNQSIQSVCKYCAKTFKKLAFFEFKLFPVILIIQIKRFGYNELNKEMKRSFNVTLSETLDMGPWIYQSKSQDKKRVAIYKLKSVLLHHGPFNTSGHYTCNVLIEDSELETHWENCNNNKIKIIHNNFFTNDNVTSSIYMLIYELQ